MLPKGRANHYQKIARDAEWNAIKQYIKAGFPESPSSNFLDVGCGAGYSMKRAKDELNCQVFGIDPEPGAHVVDRTFSPNLSHPFQIIKAEAESIPFPEKHFDTVYSSHVL